MKGKVAVILAVLCAAGCSRAHRAAERRPLLRLRTPEVRLHPTETRVDAVLGTVLVMPVAMDGPVPAQAAIPARMDDGRKVDAQLFWVSRVRDERGGWLAGAGEWRATPASAGSRPSAVGSWVVVAELPAEAAGQGLTVGGQRVPLNWVVDAGLVRPKAGNAEENPWKPVFSGTLTEEQLRMLAPEAASPFRRWRYRLLTRGLAPEARGPGEVALARLGDPVLEALARQTEGKWQAALAELWLTDADLAERVKQRLAGMVDFGGGVVAPAWPTDEPSLDALLSDLLNRRLEPSQRAERAAAWLESLPPAAAWVIDDVGLRDAQSGRPLATCGVANLLDRTTLAWASTEQGGASPELTTVPAFGAATMPVHDGAEGSLGPMPMQAHVGRWSGTRMLALGKVPATPPGARIEAFLGDWTMAAWLAGSVDDSMAPEPDRAGAVLLRRSGDRWWIYAEFRCPEMKAEGDAAEMARFWLGPRGRPSAVIRAMSGGAVANEVASVPAKVGTELGEARVTRERGKWVARVPVPASCIEADGTLRIAIERRDAAGRRTAWPRPMLPWQAEPGRLAVDLSAWGDASEAK